MSVPPLRSCREADDIAGPDLGQDALERYRGHVEVLIYDYEGYSSPAEAVAPVRSCGCLMIAFDAIICT
jgi:hypothetical protein